MFNDSIRLDPTTSQTNEIIISNNLLTRPFPRTKTAKYENKIEFTSLISNKIHFAQNNVDGFDSNH